MLINDYAVTEKAVVQGVSAGVGELLKDVSSFSKPDVVVETIASAVMAELCAIIDFTQQPLRFTPDMIRSMWAAAQEANPPPPPDGKS